VRIKKRFFSIIYAGKYKAQDLKFVQTFLYGLNEAKNINLLLFIIKEDFQHSTP